MKTPGNPPIAAVTSMETLVEYCYASAFRALEDGDTETAQRLFGVMAAMAPRDERAWIGLAMVREGKKQWRAAAGLYGVGTSFAPASAWCHVGKGRNLLRLGRLIEAEAAFEQAEQLSDDPELLSALAEGRGLS